MLAMRTDVVVAEVGWFLSLVTFARGGYTIIVTTGNDWGAGTNAYVEYRLQGTNGDSGTRRFPGQNNDHFEGDSVDTFSEPEDFGVLKSVTIGHDGSGLVPSWQLIKVNIRDKLRDSDYEFLCDCWIPEDTGGNIKTFTNQGGSMATGETLLRWEANLCNLSPEPQVYESSGDHVTALLSDRSLQTCQLLFPSSRSSMTSVILVHRLLSSRSPRLNVFGQYIDCSPINGLWMFAMEATGTLQPCISYTGVEVGDFTMCRYRCDTDGLVNYVVLGISDLQTLSTTNSAVICDIALV